MTSNEPDSGTATGIEPTRSRPAVRSQEAPVVPEKAPAAAPVPQESAPASSAPEEQVPLGDGDTGGAEFTNEEHDVPAPEGELVRIRVDGPMGTDAFVTDIDGQRYEIDREGIDVDTETAGALRDSAIGVGVSLRQEVKD